MVDMDAQGDFGCSEGDFGLPVYDPIQSQWHIPLTLNELAGMSEPKVTTYKQVLTTTAVQMQQKKRSPRNWCLTMMVQQRRETILPHATHVSQQTQHREVF